jgi:hypothetical protein
MQLANNNCEGASLLVEFTHLVKTSSVFQGIAEEEDILLELCSVVSFRYFKDGDSMTRDGETDVFFIIKGNVKMEVENVFTELCAPDFCKLSTAH